MGNMDVVVVLLVASALAVILDLLNVHRKKDTILLGERIPTVAVACILVTLSYIYMAYAYISNNFSVEEVYYYSNSNLNVMGRLYSSWASSGGSWLFLSFLFAIGYLGIRIVQGESKTHRNVYVFLDTLFLFFILVVLIQNPLKLLPVTPHEGRGLNPLLQTPWMLIHPPIVFIGYVLTFFSLAFTFELSEKNIPQSNNSRIFASVAWLFLTLGIALGSIWAYEVLGWGGYWGWDPVETSSLIPWITLTAYFHLTAQLTGPKTLSKETMLMVTSSLVILASAITRGGLAVSVHAFGSSPIGFLLLTLMGITILYYIYEQKKSKKKLIEFNSSFDDVYTGAMSLNFISLILMASVCLWGLMFPIFTSGLTGGEVSMDAVFFNKWTYPFVLLFLAALVGCNLYRRLNMKMYAGILSLLLILGIIGAFTGFPTGNMLANLGIPLTVFALISVGYSLIAGLIEKRASIQISRSILHLGTVLIMIGILVGNSTTMNYGEVIATPNSSIDLGGLQLQFGQFSVIDPFGTVQPYLDSTRSYSEGAGLMIPVTVVGNGVETTENVYILLYTLSGVVSRPTVIRSAGQDVYLVLHQSQTVYTSLQHILGGMTVTPNEFVMSVTIFPLMNLIWLGVVLLCIGIIYPLFALKKTPPK
jgi:cytochrome c-type biogenesis protein CcmF